MVVQGLRFGCLLVMALAIALASDGVASATSEDEAVARHSRALIFGSDGDFRDSLAALRSRGNPDVSAAMILALRYKRYAAMDLSAALEDITGHEALGWFDWMVWQEANPEIEPHPSFTELKLEVLRRLDPNFLRFFRSDWADPGKMKVRLEEITWGGVAVDGIPSLDHPKLIAAAEAEADDLLDDDLVFGVEINGDARAYPLRIMGWHEMFNEVRPHEHLFLCFPESAGPP